MVISSACCPSALSWDRPLQLMTAGASVDAYYLASQMTSGVQPPSHLAVSSMAAALSSSRLQAVFQLSLPYSTSLLSSVGVIYAAGPVDSTGALEQHTYVLIAPPYPNTILRFDFSSKRCLMIPSSDASKRDRRSKMSRMMLSFLNRHMHLP